ncbi:1-acyl-sn-glycerol-3-phosphate acyltransferase [Gemmata sp. JC673]|uniref:1-acyl-sn-glycerol-3-phosphate acyltransferase n=1 Tax=Gemmata algarum TaxID=2975278 RepID=A0ABU5F4H5_9BACT|nr:lysophospholipid acyltransferase family protein [Gemmata algarum]MDY3561662.1 1-acyl-sn-glycerol-3-phosphate acyltransferase [Gemmata algarum]
MPESESPQVVRDRRSLFVAVAVVCLALPSAAFLVSVAPGGDRTDQLLWFAGTAVAGAALPFLYWNPYRALGFVPLAALAWLAAAAHGVYWHEWPGWAHGLPLGLIVGACARGQRGKQPAAETALLAGAVLAGVGVLRAFDLRGRPYDVMEWFALVAAVALVMWSWARLFRPAFEVSLEPACWLAYRIRWHGPGFARFPRTGPCLVIANHACWLDPIFLVKVLPRPLTPMMTSGFYDLPVIRTLMIKFGVIRVPDRALKKEAPELQEAIAALDRGECVVIFPEGYLRRSSDRELRRFGQGVWKILKERPNTPVFAAWIEGGWGSYTSHSNGPPTRNKRPDVRRRISVGMLAAVTVPPVVLEGHLRTRTHLMNLVSAARGHAGLEPLAPFDLPAKTEEAEAEGDV